MQQTDESHMYNVDSNVQMRDYATEKNTIHVVPLEAV